MRFPMIFGTCRKLATVAEATEELILQEFRRLFGVVGGTYVVQSGLDGFDGFFDVEDFTALKDKDSLQIVRKVSSAEGGEGGSGENHDLTDEEDEEETEKLSLREKTGGKMIPAHYKLPVFDLSIQAQLKKNIPLCPLFRKRLVKVLYQDMIKFITDMYPQPVEYTRVVDALLRTYPALADKPLPGLQWTGLNDEGYTWRDALRCKFKFERRKMDAAEVPHLIEKRNSFAPKTPRARENPEAWLTGLLRARESTLNKVSALPQYATGQNAATTKKHIEDIKAQWDSDTPDMETIDMSMAMTKVNRRFEMVKKTVKEIMKAYPVLGGSNQWVVEAQRQWGGNVREHLKKVLTKDVAAKCVERLKNPKGQLIASNIIAAHGENVYEGQMAATLSTLPWLCSEAVIHWIITYDVVTTSKPMLLVERDAVEGGDNEFVGARFVPYLDGVALVRPSENLSLLEAIETLGSAVHLMNVMYPERNEKSWRVLNEVLLGLPLTAPVRPCIQKVINILHK